MAAFTTRVELHSANAEDYTTLHEAMETEGFIRLIESDDGAVYHLPTAEYNYYGEVTRDFLLEAAKRASEQTGKAAGILVTESKGRSWSGLKTKTKA